MDKWDEDIDEDYRVYYERREASDLNSVNTARARYRWGKLALTAMLIIAAVAIVLWRLRG